MNDRWREPISAENKLPKAILVGIELLRDGSQPLDPSLEELEGLATTANYQPVASFALRLHGVNPKTFLGSGKVTELREAVELRGADTVIIDINLSPGQNRNLEKALNCRVIDRSWLILEIFSLHAQSREAKTQVELARLKYALPRLTRMWGHLSRQRGGIGLREVGETQIQLDRRMIREQIHKLEIKLKQIDKEKQTQRKQRRDVYRVALVGYTNVGKSSIMNCLTGANTLVEDKLFATLDATTRKVRKNFPFPILLSDTVGLINKLPHDLVASFKSTLDEVREADLLIHVADICHPDARNQMEIAERLLRELGARETEIVWVFNKVDRVPDRDLLSDMIALHPRAIRTSCKTGAGIAELRQAIVRHYEKRLSSMRVNLDYSQSGLVPAIRKHAMVVRADYGEEGITLDLKFEPGEKTRLERILNGPAQAFVS
ncbi:MAG: GTPase HflX [Nitrospinae bacterium]|nr:GTPase HflX [Nitrospinota bacterium]